MNEQEKYDWMVFVRCLTYNHAPYIEDAMNGFAMQETDFPFVCAIVDDTSTDGEQEVIKNYFNEHFNLEDKSLVRHEETDDYVLTFARHKTNLNCHFAVIFLKYNHYSIKKPKLHYIAEWRNKAKYIAVCEGDDYWTAKDKLQQHINFLEEHDEYTMVCNRTQLYSVKKNIMIGENYCYNKSRDIDPKDVINRSGLFISTCSIVYREVVEKNKPNYWKNCLVGDYPLQIACSLKGKTYFFNEIMSVYRVENSKSWVGQQQWGELTSKRLNITKAMVEMFRGFAKDYPEYESVFMSRIASYINSGMPNRHSPWKNRCSYVSFFKDYIRDYSILWYIDLWIIMLGIPKVSGHLHKLFLKKYQQRTMMY
jgi:hypothetical protein